MANRLARYIDTDEANVPITFTKYVVEGGKPNITDLMGYNKEPFPEPIDIARMSNNGIITGILYDRISISSWLKSDVLEFKVEFIFKTSEFGIFGSWKKSIATIVFNIKKIGLM